MGQLKKITDNTKRIDPALVERLEKLLDYAKQVKLVSVVVVAITCQRTILSSHFYGDKPQPYLMIGALEAEKLYISKCIDE